MIPRSISVKLFLALNEAISLNAGCSHLPENAGPVVEAGEAIGLPEDGCSDLFGDDAASLDEGVALGERPNGEEDTEGGREGSLVIGTPAFEPCLRYAMDDEGEPFPPLALTGVDGAE